MERTLTFVPVTREEASALARGIEPVCPREGFAATPELVAALGYASDQGEDAEYAALVLASVWALSHFGERLVLVAELDARLVCLDADVDTEVAEVDNGGVQVAGVPRASVVAWFTDEPDAAKLAARAASASKGLDIDAAWELGEVQDLVTSHDLLWHAAEELGQVDAASEGR